MKPIFILPALAGAVFAVDVLTILSQLPACSPNCLVQGAAKHGCSATDYKCQCSKTSDITKDVAPCLVDAGCRLKEIGEVAKAIVSLCTEVAAQSGQNLTSPASELSSSTGSSNVPGAASRSVDAGLSIVAALVAAAAVF